MMSRSQKSIEFITGNEERRISGCRRKNTAREMDLTTERVNSFQILNRNNHIQNFYSYIDTTRRNVFRQFEAILLCHAVKDFQEPVVVPGHHNTETDEFSVKMLERGTVADDQPVFCAGFKQLKRSEPFFHYFQKKSLRLPDIPYMPESESVHGKACVFLKE